MIKITIQEHTYEAPSKLSELSIDDYLRLIDLELEDSLQFINKFVGIPLDVLRLAPMDEIDNLAEGFRYICMSMQELEGELEKIAKGGTIKYIMIGETKHKVPQRIDKLDVGRWLDLQIKFEEYKGRELEFMPAMMAILLQDKYQPEKNAELESYFRQVDCMSAYRLNAFFFGKSERYRKYTNRFFPTT